MASRFSLTTSMSGHYVRPMKCEREKKEGIRQGRRMGDNKRGLGEDGAEPG